MNNDRWFYEKDGERYGPVSRAELESLIQRGELASTNLAWRPGERDWSASGTFTELAAAFQPQHGEPTSTPPSAPPSDPAPSPPPPPAPGPAPEPRDSTSVPPPPPPPGPAQQPPAQQPPAQQPSAQQPPAAPHSQPVAQIQNRATPGSVRGLPRKAMLIVAGVLIGIAAVWALWAVFFRSGSPAPSDSATASPATTLYGVRVPDGYAGPVAQIKIDAYPWAAVTRFHSSDLGDLAVPGAYATPLVLLVPPGSYRVEFEGGQSCDLVVAEEESQLCARVMRDIDSAKYYEEMNW